MSISFTKVAVLQPEKRLHQRWFPVVSLIFQNSFLPKHVWMVTASVKFLCCVDLIISVSRHGCVFERFHATSQRHLKEGWSARHLSGDWLNTFPQRRLWYLSDFLIDVFELHLIWACISWPSNYISFWWPIHQTTSLRKLLRAWFQLEISLGYL